MKIRSSRGAVRSKYIDVLEKRIRRLSVENEALRRDNELLSSELQTYNGIKEQIEKLEAQYIQGIREAHEISDKCKEMLAGGRIAQAKFKKQMRGFFKTMK